MPQKTTIGRTLVNRALPEDMRSPVRELNKKQAKQLFQELAERYPDKYSDVMHSLDNIARTAATEYGGPASVSLHDLDLPPKIKQYRKKLNERIQRIAQDPNIPREEKSAKIVALMRRSTDIIQDKLEQEAGERGNTFALSILKGIRGSPSQLTQILFGNRLMADQKGRPIPIPGLHGYGEGITDAEYWGDAYGSRAGYSQVQFATAKAGYLGKQMAQMAQRLKVTGNDCKTVNGLPVDGGDPEIVGSVLARDIAGLKAGHVIEKKDLAKLEELRPVTRSVVTCKQKEGVCQKCSGKRDQGEFPAIGTYSGITAARIAAEPLVQVMSLSAKHAGPEVKEEEEEIGGFDEINQFLQVPKHFRGGAVVAPVDGRVTLISKAPQGGHYVKIGDKQLHIPINKEVKVKRGDKIEAGDIISSGLPNPADIGVYKGLGEGRRYFVDKFSEILRKNGVPTHRRNVEILARAFFDKVRITKPEGFEGWAPGEVVSYSDIQNRYKPRKGSKLARVKQAKGKYLEQPLLHYSIGTKVTPTVVKELSSAGINEVDVHPDPPGFEPFVVRAMSLVSHDPDWKTRLGAFNLKKSFLESATKGSASPHETTSPVPSLMDSSRL